jgi:hypothetical protein
MSSTVSGRPVRLVVTAMPGRFTPGSVPSSSVAAPTTAPVLPMLTAAPASPALQASVMLAIELSGLARSATAGDSPMPTTCVAWRIAKPGSPPNSASLARTSFSSPTSSRRSTGSGWRNFGETASSAPRTIASGAWSPPITSRAIRALGIAGGASA